MSPDPAFDLVSLRNTLHVAVVSDVLDALGLRHQVVNAPLRRASGQGVLAGYAKTTLWEDVEGVDPKPYELELQAVDACQTGDVFVAAAAGSTRSGVWGELLSTAARHHGCLGAIVDGPVRDVAKMNKMGFDVFALGTCARDSLHRQRVVAVDVEVELGGVRVNPRDLLFADDDGVVVVPARVAAEVMAKAHDKVMAENKVREEIRAGESATDVFRRYGVL